MMKTVKDHFNDHESIGRMNEFYGTLSLNQLKAGAPSLFSSIQALTKGGRKITILDVGCGEGSRTVAMATIRHVRIVAAATPFQQEFNEVQKKTKIHPNIKPLLTGLPELKLSSLDKFELVYCGNVMQYLNSRQRKKSLAIMAGHIKKEGALVVRVPNVPTWKNLRTYHPTYQNIKMELAEVSKILKTQGIRASLKDMRRLPDHIPASNRAKNGSSPISFTEYTLTIS